jgi:dTDP-4-amino-4,6-dideoxygalactose transaminase
MSDDRQAMSEIDPFIVFGAPSIGTEEIDEVVGVLKSGWLGTGPRVKRFEQDFATYKRVDQQCVAAINSCTAALHLSLLAAGVGPGDEVIAPALTFCATVNAIIHAGATPVLADVESQTMNIDPADLEARITPRTRAIVPVHFAGRPCDMDALMGIAERHNLKIIEDCAHAIETEYHGSKAGTFGDFGCFSFYVTKNVTSVEGGMVIAKQQAAINRVKTLALHGLSHDAWRRFSDSGYQHYYVTELGFKYNMTDVQAAIGIHQLARVEDNWLRRQAVWDRYQEAFSDLPATCPTEPAANTRHAYHLYTLLIDPESSGMARDAFLDAMTEARIGVGVHYLSLSEHPYYREAFQWRVEDYPNAMRIGRQTVSLPLSAGLTDESMARVSRVVRRILTHGR